MVTVTREVLNSKNGGGGEMVWKCSFVYGHEFVSKGNGSKIFKRGPGGRALSKLEMANLEKNLCPECAELV
jgi:hypothetical protein